jgi:hypothetical protein
MGFAFEFPENRADFGCNSQITRKKPGLGLFSPEFLYLLASAYLRSVGFVSRSIEAKSAANPGLETVPPPARFAIPPLPFSPLRGRAAIRCHVYIMDHNPKN